MLSTRITPIHTNRFFYFFLLCLLPALGAFAHSTNSSAAEVVNVPATQLQIFEDKSGQMGYAEVMATGKFMPVEQEVLNLGISESTFWIKVPKSVATADSGMLLMLQQPMIDDAVLYAFNGNVLADSQAITKMLPFTQRRYREVDYIYSIPPISAEASDFLIKVRSSSQMVIPVKVGSEPKILKAESNKEILFGLYSGIIIVMCLYNLFVFFSVRDRSYLLYVLYILLIGLTQTTLPGFTHKFLWPDNTWMAYNAINLFSCLVGIAALEFIRVFLKTKEHTPRLNWGITIFEGLFVISIALTFAGKRTQSFQIMQGATALASLFSLYISYRIYRMNYRPARFFLIAWSVLLVGAVIFVLKDLGVIPFNTFTTYTLQMASVIEIVLLSFALADKINILRIEKEESQEQALKALEENARIISEQNVILETQVNLRTKELNQSNEDLKVAMQELKDAEMQLVESEKMASLGQLTAGIAHEINNPINFVTSNVKPLKRDVEMIITMLDEVSAISLSDEPATAKKEKIESLKEEYDFDYLKTEIDYLLKGITEGSNRTAEIVKGLRIFSRLDEDDLKKANVNEGLDSTIIIVNNLLDNKINIEKNYGNIPMVECYPGKLNQVFLNIITNGIHALKAKFKDTPGGVITITTTNTENTVLISIEDNGTGMDENTKKKLFEPFFTTKDVGEGTGLGLSIAYNTIKKHNGTITVNSVLGEGTEFVIEIPIIH